MATLHNRIAWTVSKDGRVTQAELRARPNGIEFRLLDTGTVLRSELWRHGYDPAALDAAVASVRRLWMAKGWQPVEPAASPDSQGLAELAEATRKLFVAKGWMMDTKPKTPPSA